MGGRQAHGGKAAEAVGLSRSARAELIQLLDRALAARGDGWAAAEALGMPPAAWTRLIVRLRRRGLARTVTLHDPRVSGLPCESVCLVKLRQASSDAMDGFEAACRRDPAVHGAARIAGRFDYQLGSCHADLRDAERWRRRLEDHPEILRVEQRIVHTVVGHGLRDIPLSGLRQTAGGAYPRRARERQKDHRADV